jgi:DNA replication factor GINS
VDLEELRSVREQERRTDSLQHLRDSFYDDAAEYVRQLKHERSRRAEQAGDPYAPAAMRLTDEIDTAEEVIESLYERRRGKVVKLASFAAAGMPAETDGMTEQERSMFDDVVERIENNEERVLGALDGSTDAPEGQIGGEATDAARTVPATDAAGTAAATDAAGSAGEADTVGTPTEAETVDTPDETGAVDDAEPVAAAPAPGASEESVAAADERPTTADGVTAGGGDGSVLADAMGGPSPSGEESSGDAVPSGETAGESSDGSVPAGETGGGSSGDRPAAEAAVATGVGDAAGGGTDSAGEAGAAPSAAGSPTAADGPATGADASVAGDTPVATDPSAGNDTATGNGTPTESDTPTKNDTPAGGAAETKPASPAGERGTGPASDEPAPDDTPTVERATVRVTSDVGEVFGVDDRTYELAASDVVHLPQMVAEPLVERGAAEQL